MRPGGHVHDHLHRIRWGLLAALMVVSIVTRDEWGWWLVAVGVALLAGFWLPGLAALRHAWSPSASRARRDERIERRRIAAARRDLARQRGLFH